MKTIQKFLLTLVAISFAFALVGFVASNGNQSQPETFPSIVAEITDGPDDTYEYYIDMKSFSKVGLQLTLSGGSGTCTVTIEATMRDDGTADASCVYVDVTEAVFGSASFTASAMLIDDTGSLALARYLKVKVVASTGDADDADWTILARKIQ